MRDNIFESDLQIDTETLRYAADQPGQAGSSVFRACSAFAHDTGCPGGISYVP